MTTDFSSSDFQLVNISVKAALKSIYPHASPEEIKALRITECLEVIKNLASSFADSSYQFLNIPKTFEGVYLNGIDGMDLKLVHLKIFLSRSDTAITVCFYPRSFKQVPKEEVYSRHSRPVIKVDFPKTSSPTFRVAEQLVSKLPSETKKSKKFLEAFNQEVQIRTNVIGVPSLPALFHHTIYSCKGENPQFVKFLLFQEYFEHTLIEHPLFAEKEKKIGKLLIYLTYAVHQLHKKNLCHHQIDPTSFVYKTVLGNDRFALVNTTALVHLKRRSGVASSRGKPLDQASYESIKHMLETESCVPTREGFRSDMWALGRTIFYLITSKTPNFLRFACLLPEFNYLSHRLNEEMHAFFKRNERQDFSDNAPISRKRTATPKGAATLLMQLRRDWELTSIPGRLDTLNKVCDRAVHALTKIDTASLGRITDGSQTASVDKLERHIQFLTQEMRDILSDKTFFEELKKQDERSKLAITFYSICEMFDILNTQLVKKLLKAEKHLTSAKEIELPQLELARKLLLPNPANRMTSKGALAFLEKAFPKKYAAFKKELK